MVDTFVSGALHYQVIGVARQIGEDETAVLGGENLCDAGTVELAQLDRDVSQGCVGLRVAHGADDAETTSL